MINMYDYEMIIILYDVHLLINTCLVLYVLILHLSYDSWYVTDCLTKSDVVV